MSRSNHQLSLGPLPLADRTRDEAVRPKCTQREEASAIAAELFDRALTLAGVTTAEVAYILDVSESLVRRWRSKDARERISFVQLLMLPRKFHTALKKEWNKRDGSSREALLRLLDAAGDLAVSEGL